ncbi:MAG: asparagine synthase (glutamine-hydrolyzing) [Lentisphaeria bacterium]|nr:asparagine synthase (glutamine-hydrolyzing) [Lentisphaeria bacterium]NQZ70949.1 asparagine synthase (glutamine-hydrolyzing) [Lentisphaeria bacterium]
MCGIAGLIDPEQRPDLETLNKMADALRLRGPDEFGTFVHNDMGIAHTRLSIIDLQSGKQPIFNEDKTLALTFNGEIYNYQELRTELKAKGHIFTTNSDSEVLVHLYEEEKENMLLKLNGMFAFAIVHIETGDCFIARDRMGQKPLFYTQRDKRFAFASGLRSLLALDWIDADIDESVLLDYLMYYYVPAPKTMIRNVFKLLPGHYARFKSGKLEIHQYWKAECNPTYTGSFEDACDETRSRVQEAVNRRLIADVPLACFLSGGLDSSIITYCAQQASSQTMHSYAIGFPVKEYDERHYAQMVADHLKTEHHFLEVNPNDAGYLFDLISEYEEPFADASMLPTAMLCKYARENVTVALSGDAADELFGGYYRYRVYQLSQSINVLPKSLRTLGKNILGALLPAAEEERSKLGKVQRLLKIADSDKLERYLKIIRRLEPAAAADLLNNADESAFASLADQSDINQIMSFDINSYLPNDILVKVDRASMANSLELRSPFLDPDLVDFALSLPYEFKQQGKLRKRILYESYKDKLPMDVIKRPKMGFGVPIAKWFRTDWKEHLDIIREGKLIAKSFKQSQIQSIIDEHLQSKQDHSYTLFALLVLEKWYSNL